MAREESNREDLLREATALVERIELLLGRQQNESSAKPEAAERVVAGFRANNAFSVFFDADPVYQFNAIGELRRAFCDGLLFKASQCHLASIRRIRTEDQVQLQTRIISDSEEAAFLKRMSNNLSELSQRLDAESFEIVGQVPENAGVLDRVRQWLTAHRSIAIASRPNA